MNEGLVAPSWSDSGDVPVGEVTEYEPVSLGPNLVQHMTGPDTGWLQIKSACGGEYRVNFTYENVGAWKERDAKPSDPNAKPAIPALTRVGGNKRGPGWCDE